MKIVLNHKTKKRVETSESGCTRFLKEAGAHGNLTYNGCIMKHSHANRKLCYSITRYTDSWGVEFSVYESDHEDALKFLQRKVARDGNVTLARLAK
jgi:hypothetical protein